jgi:hypothetical protein
MTPIDLVLQRADAHGLRPAGKGRWRMRGVCHGGRNASAVSIAEGDGGAVLLKCWAGCDVARVAEALGLDLVDLFPPSATAGHGSPPQRRPFTAGELLRALGAELNVAWVILGDVAAGRELGPKDRARAGLARERCMAMIQELSRVS